MAGGLHAQPGYRSLACPRSQIWLGCVGRFAPALQGAHCRCADPVQWEANAFDADARKLIEEMVMDLDYALDSFQREQQRQQAEAALQQSEQRLRTIIETEPECIKVVDKDGRLLEINRAGMAMLQADSVEQVRRYGVLHFVLPDYHADFLNLHQQVMSGQSGTLEFEIAGLHGQRRWLETHAAPMRDDR
jgi:PAS domain S-box-containing protein